MGEPNRKLLRHQDGLRMLFKGILLTGLGCGGDNIQEPTTGGVIITTVTSGSEVDADGYSITIDQGAETAITINATMERGDLEPGSHMVHLFGLAANCTVAGENPRAVTVSAGETAAVSFEISCSAATGSLQITSATSGASPDPDGYQVTVDGSDRGALGVSGALSVDGLQPGSYSVGLGGVAANCVVQGDNPRSVAVTAGASATATFTIVCSEPQPGAGSVRVTTVTTGTEPDADGYTFAVDGGTNQAIGATATTIVANVPAGGHQVQLSGAAANCMIQGTNPRAITVSSSAIADVSFAIACSATTGSLTITTTTTGSPVDPDGYTVTVDRGTAQAIAIAGTLEVGNLATGAHSVTLAGVAANCAVQGRNPRSITTRAGAAVTVAFTILCSLPAMRWTRMASGTTSSLRDISGSSASDIFAVDDEGTIRHYDGVSWAPQSAPAFAFQVWATSATDAFATARTSSGGPALLHYDGQAWSVMVTLPVPTGLENHQFVWHSIWGVGIDLFAVGEWELQDGDGRRPQPGLVAHYDGASWSAEVWNQFTENAESGYLTDVWASSRDDVYLLVTENVGDPTGFVWHKGGNGWVQVFADGPASFDHIWGASPTDIIVTGSPTDRNVPALWQFDGTKWDGDPHPHVYWGAMWGIPGQVLYAVGERTIYRGTAIYTDLSGAFLSDIWGSSAVDVYAVGTNGTILHGTPR
jgi:hypothetical protein